MRQYIGLKAGDGTMLIHRKHASHLFLAYAEGTDNYEALEAEHDNLLAGANWAHKAKDWELVKRFAWATDLYLGTRGYWKDRKLLLANTIKATKELGDKSGMAITLHQMGNLAYVTGDLPEARRLYQESLKIKLELGDKRGMAITLAQSALLEEKEDNIKKALDLIKRAEDMFLELESPMAEQARSVRERVEKKRK
jgi:tetratricopeptide (TPR) repeat protein